MKRKLLSVALVAVCCSCASFSVFATTSVSQVSGINIKNVALLPVFSVSARDLDSRVLERAKRYQTAVEVNFTGATSDVQKRAIGTIAESRGDLRRLVIRGGSFSEADIHTLAANTDALFLRGARLQHDAVEGLRNTQLAFLGVDEGVAEGFRSRDWSTLGNAVPMLGVSTVEDAERFLAARQRTGANLRVAYVSTGPVGLTAQQIQEANKACATLPSGTILAVHGALDTKGLEKTGATYYGDPGLTVVGKGVSPELVKAAGVAFQSHPLLTVESAGATVNFAGAQAYAKLLVATGASGQEAQAYLGQTYDAAANRLRDAGFTGPVKVNVFDDQDGIKEFTSGITNRVTVNAFSPTESNNASAFVFDPVRQNQQGFTWVTRYTDAQVKQVPHVQNLPLAPLTPAVGVVN